MAERPKGISQEAAEAYALLGIPYEGYVEGIGYQSLLAQTMGSCYFQERGCAIPQFEQVMDSSPEMRIQSVKISSEDLIRQLVKFKEDGRATVNMGHGKYVDLSENSDLVAKIESETHFVFGYRDIDNGTEETIRGKLVDFHMIFGDSELLFSDLLMPGEVPSIKSENSFSSVCFIAASSSLGYSYWQNHVFDGEYYRPTKGVYRGQNVEVWKKTKGGKNYATRHGERIPKSANAAKKVQFGKYVKAGGSLLNWFGIGLTVWDIYENGLGVENGADLIFGGVAFVPGVGWVISGVYFVGKELVQPQLIGSPSCIDFRELPYHQTDNTRVSPVHYFRDPQFEF